MQERERNLVKTVARLSPWLAPIPSGYFVARASEDHLTLPLPIAIVIGVIIEFLGIASVHTWLWLSDWNANKRERDPNAPADLALLLGGVYIITTIGLTVLLEVLPALSTYAPAIFPLLAVVGAVNLALIAQQEGREQALQRERAERKISRRWKSVNLDERVVQDVNPLSILSNVEKAKNDRTLETPLHITGLHSEQPRASYFPMNTVKVNTKLDILDTLVDALRTNPDVNVADLARRVGRSRTTIYKYLNELEQTGRISRNGR